MPFEMILMLVAMAVLIFFMFRNGKKRQQAQQEMRERMLPGVDVMLGAGIYGTLISLDEETNRATIRSADSLFEVHLQAIAQVVDNDAAQQSEAASESLAPDDDPEFGERVMRGTDSDASERSEDALEDRDRSDHDNNGSDSREPR